LDGDAAACAITTSLSAIEITPVRSPPSFSATWKSNAPGPVDAAAGTWIQDAMDVGRHGQPAIVVTVTRPEPPPPSIAADVGVISKVHGRAASAIETRWPLTVTFPEREAIWGFASTLAVKVDSPCPVPVLNRIHAASLLEFHAQSRVVATVTVTLPPSAPTDCGFAVTEVAHRTSEGPETWETLVEPHPATRSDTMAATEATTRENG
jgi:hypothetical protein